MSDVKSQNFEFMDIQNDATNGYTSRLIVSPGDKPYYGVGDTVSASRQKALESYLDNGPATMRASFDKDGGGWSLKPSDTVPHIDSPELSTAPLEKDIAYIEKLLAGLIEKAKREGCQEHRLLAMAHTDFERGIMAFSKAIQSMVG